MSDRRSDKYKQYLKDEEANYDDYDQDDFVPNVIKLKEINKHSVKKIPITVDYLYVCV